MGNAFRKLTDWFGGVSPRYFRVVMLGLDNSGKTTILYKLRDQANGIPKTTPTLGFNVETVKFKSVSFTMWDVGGQNQLRPLWRHYFVNTDALIFVIDASDRERIAEAAHEFQDFPALVFANKQDVPRCLAPVEVCRHLDLGKVPHDMRRWRVQGTVAISGGGLYQGLEWLVNALKDRQRADHAQAQRAGVQPQVPRGALSASSSAHLQPTTQLPASSPATSHPTTSDMFPDAHESPPLGDGQLLAPIEPPGDPGQASAAQPT